MFRQTAVLVCLFSACLPALAQQGPAVSASVRTRGEFWDWFQGNNGNDYAFSETIFRLGISDTHDAISWKFELAAPMLIKLPSDAVAPGAQGQQGFGATYYAANSKSTSAAMIFAKQGYVAFRLSSGKTKQKLQVGRTEFSDGAEIKPKNATLAALISTRISERLIGNFGFSDVGRSFDGFEYVADNGRNNVTLLAARPTRGVFQVDGWGEVNTNIFYGALNHQTGGGDNAGDLRVFGIGYNDYRDGVLKTDNRTVPARTADRQHINIATLGADYIHSAKSLDVLLWGVLQGGSWGALQQRAYAYAVEAGWQPKFVPVLRPWLRGGIDYGSGDHNPNDKTHGTFFQILPTPRPYARFPFFNMMNNRDVFGELVLRPSKKVTLRTDVHALTLANKKDLWYSGGGVFQPWTFGYTGRTSNGHSSLGTLFDGSFDYTIDKHFAFAAYAGHATGKMVTEAIYPKNKDADFGYVELNYKF